MRYLSILITLLVVVGLGYVARNWWVSRATTAGEVTPTVRTEPVTRGSLIESITASGEVQPKSRVSISARVAARIIELPFKEGDVVAKDKVIVRLDDRELRSSLKSVEARLAGERAQRLVADSRIAATRARIDGLKVTLADGKRELTRNKSLLASKDVSQAAVDQLQAKVDQQEHELRSASESLKGDEQNLIVLDRAIDAAAAEIDKATENLTYTEIRSPINGKVTRLNAEVGELVVTGTMNNAGTVIMEVADLSQMMVDARVDENSITSVKKGQPCKIRMEAYRDRVFDGEVMNVALANYVPEFDRNRSSSQNRSMSSDGGKYYKVQILLKTGDEQILSGLSADADIEINSYADVLKVPSQAVLGRSPDSLPADVRGALTIDPTKATIPVVFRLIDGKGVVTPVTIGASDLTHTVIKSGLAAGDVIVTGPYKNLESLQHGQKLKSEPAKPTSKPTTTTAPSTSPSTTPTVTPHPSEK